MYKFLKNLKKYFIKVTRLRNSFYLLEFRSKIFSHDNLVNLNEYLYGQCNNKNNLIDL